MSENLADLPTSDPTSDPADTSTEASTEAISQEELFDLLSDGVTEKVTKAQLLQLASHGKAAAKRMTEASLEKKNALRLAELIRQNPIAAAKELTPDFNEKDFLTKRLAEMMDEELMSPQERQHRDDMAELQALRAATKKAKDDADSAELDRLTTEKHGELDVEFAEAMKEAALPKTMASARRLAQYMLDAEEAGLVIPTVKLAAQVKQDMIAELTQLLSVADDDAFESLLGSDLLTKAQKLSLKKVKTPGEKLPASTKSREPATPVRKKSQREALSELGYGDSLF
jgi:hypothetical protein